MRVFILALTPALALAQPAAMDLLNHNRPMADAHNCYPYDGKWNDRIDRALGTGFPIGIEQDLAWGVDKATGKGHAVVSHAGKTTGEEPTLKAYFFERVRPIVEQALKENNRASWPLITVHFDFKDNRPELLQAVWELLGEYESWITTAPLTKAPGELGAFDVKPILVLTEDNDAQEEVFFTNLKPGSRLRLFGSAHTARVTAKTMPERMRLAVTTPPEELLTERPTNYRRWWNNSWAIVEEGGQTKAGDWTPADEARLNALVNHAHKLGFWIRFYTLDGFAPEENQGWSQPYNFGSREAALLRWKAAISAGVNLIASDHYEDLARTLKH